MSFKYTLHYFDYRGRAELSRLVFAAAGVKFYDNRITDWPVTRCDAPIGTLPYLEFGGIKLPQSLTIARYLANEFNLAGKNILEKAMADAIVDTVKDVINLYVKDVLCEPDLYARKQAEAKFIAEDLPQNLTNLEKLVSLYGGNKEFSVGDSLTYADLAIFSFVESFFEKSFILQIQYPLLNQICKSVKSNSNIATYLENRPQSEL